MGRHSAPDDDAEDVGVAIVAPPEEAAEARPRPGRHSRPDADAAGPAPVAVAAEAPPADAPLPEAVVAEAPPAEAPATKAPKAKASKAKAPKAKAPKAKAPKGDQSTAADLALLRARPDVRARVIAAVVVPFLLYTLVLLLIGSMRVYLLWVWIPLVSAGVLAGSLLDAAHRRQPEQQPEQQPPDR